jgi:hypothetical protein
MLQRGVHHRELLSWYHRQFLIASESRYCLNHPLTSSKRHMQLAYFFIGKYVSVQIPPTSWSLWLKERHESMRHRGVELNRCTRPQPFCFEFADGGLSFFKYQGNGSSLNRRRCVEAVHHLIHGGLFYKAVTELCSFDGICARMQCGELFTMLQHFSILEQKFAEKHQQNECMRLQHFRRWLISSADFILRKPRLHSLISCSLQPSQSIARREMLALFQLHNFKEIGHFNLSSVANMLLCCPRLHFFGGKSLKFRFNRKSVSCVSISERFSAFIILKKTKERRFHCVEVRDNCHSAIVETFSLNDKTYSKISASWNPFGDPPFLAIACVHHDDDQSMLFLWSKTKSFIYERIPGLACLSWCKHDQLKHHLALVVSLSDPSSQTHCHKLNIYDLTSGVSECKLLSATIASSTKFPNGKISPVHQLVQIELLSFGLAKNFIHFVCMGEANDCHAFFECSSHGFQLLQLNCIVVDSSICPRNGGKILQISNDIPKMLAVACSHGTAMYPIVSDKIFDGGMNLIEFDEAVHVALFMMQDPNTLLVLTVSHFPNNPAILHIWCPTEQRDRQLACSVRLHPDFFSNCFSCGSHWYATPTEELEASYVTFWNLAEVLRLQSHSGGDVQQSSLVSGECKSFSPVLLDQGTVTQLCWKSDSSVVASIGVASTPLSFDVVDFWTWSSQPESQHPTISHTSRISFRCLESVKSIHWIPSRPPVQVFAVLLFDEQLQLVIFDVSEISEPKKLMTSIVWDQDIKSSAFSSCHRYLALGGSQSARLLCFPFGMQRSKENSYCDFHFHFKTVIQVDRCDVGKAASFMILMRDVNTRCLEIVRLLEVDSSTWRQSLVFVFDVEKILPSYFSLFCFKCSPDGRLAAFSCSGKGNHPSTVVVLDVFHDTSNLVMNDSVSHCISDLSWSMSSVRPDYILATGSSSILTDESSPCAFKFGIGHSRVQLVSKSKLWDPEQMKLEIGTENVSFSPDCRVVATASTTEVVNFFVVADFLE